MKVIAAYLLAVLEGNASPSAKDIKHILSSVGAEAEDGKIELLLSQVKGKDITELINIAAGREKLASVPGGGGAGGVAVAAVAATGGGGGGAAAPSAESKKEEKVEDKEESDEDMCSCLFD